MATGVGLWHRRTVAPHAAPLSGVRRAAQTRNQAFPRPPLRGRFQRAATRVLRLYLMEQQLLLLPLLLLQLLRWLRLRLRRLRRLQRLQLLLLLLQ